jgi:hypothetical protein
MAIPAQQLSRLIGQGLAGTPGFLQGPTNVTEVEPAYELLARMQKQSPPKGDAAGIPQRFQEGGVAEELLSPSEVREVPAIPFRPRTYYRNPYQGQDTYSLPERYYPARPFDPKGMFIPQGGSDFLAQAGGVTPDQNDNPAWTPMRAGSTGVEATAPDNAYQRGGVVWQRAMRALYPSTSQVNQGGHYLGERAAPNYQEGGVAEEKPRRQGDPFSLRAPDWLREWNVYNPATANPGEARFVPSGQAPAVAYNPMDLGSQMKQATALPTPEEREIAMNRVLGVGDPVTGRTLPPQWLTDLRNPITGEQEQLGAGPYAPVGRAPITGEQEFQFQEGGVVSPYEGVALDPKTGLPTFGGQQQQQAPRQQPSPAAGEPARPQGPQRPKRYEFGPADFYYRDAISQAMQEMGEQRAAPKQGYQKGGVIPKEFMQWLANGGVATEKFTPRDHLLLGLGMKYALSPKQVDKLSRSNPMPP